MHTTSHKDKTRGRCGSVEFACDRGDCGKRLMNRGLLRTHLQMHDNDLYKCHFCPWTGVKAERTRISIHLNIHFQIRSVECSFCNAKFYDRQSLSRHEEVKHERIKDRYKCTFCDFTTHSSLVLNCHKKTMQTINIY